MATKPKNDTRAEGALKRSIRSNVLNYLAKSRSEEYDRLMADAYTAAGLVYEPEPTEEQKAAETVAALFEKYPRLKTRYVLYADKAAAPIREQVTTLTNDDVPDGVDVDDVVVTPGIDPDLAEALGR